MTLFEYAKYVVTASNINISIVQWCITVLVATWRPSITMKTVFKKWKSLRNHFKVQVTTFTVLHVNSVNYNI